MSRARIGKLTIEHLDIQTLCWNAEPPSPAQKRNIELVAETIDISPISELKFTENLAAEIKITIVDYFKTYASQANSNSDWTSQGVTPLDPWTSASGAQTNRSWNDGSRFQALIVAGDSPDSPSARVDSNSDKTIFDGVVSILVSTRRGSYIGSGTPIGKFHVLTAAHVADINNDGKSNSKDGITGITVNFNYGSPYSSQISAASVATHPDYTGFNRPSINDDLAIIKLSAPIPDDVPIYQLYRGNLIGKTITMVGYGQSGSGSTGFTVAPSFTVKRTGANVVDAFYGQDDSSRNPANEVFRFDFDSPSGGNGYFGGPSLGNSTEATLGGGDSGGPSFVDFNGQVVVAGVNTFSQSLSGGLSAPYYGSLGGGINIQPYASWIMAQVTDAIFVG